MKSKYTASAKLQLIEEYKSSGKAIAAFAEENNVNRNTVASWLSACHSHTEKISEDGNFIEVKASVLQKYEQTIKIRKGELEIIIPMSTAPSHFKKYTRGCICPMKVNFDAVKIYVRPGSYFSN